MLGAATATGAERLAAFVLRAQREQPPLRSVYRWELAIARRAIRHWVEMAATRVASDVVFKAG